MAILYIMTIEAPLPQPSRRLKSLFDPSAQYLHRIKSYYASIIVFPVTTNLVILLP